MGLLDLGFLATETAEAHMHFGALLLLEKPAGESDFVGRLMSSWLAQAHVQAPFNYVPVRDQTSGLMLPRWSEAEAVVLADHVHLLHLSGTGGYQELRRLVENLHSQRLPRDRPLWDVFVIDGLESGRFAVFAKVHHAIFDGHGGIRLFEQMLADKREAPARTPFWAMASAPGAQGGGSTAAGATPALRLWQAHVGGLVRNLLEGNQHFWRWLWDPDRVSPPAFSEPRTIINGTLSAQRRIAHASLSLLGLERSAHALDASVNDVLLAICGGAVRRYLQERDALPRRSLSALVPVSLRDAASATVAGNRLTFVPMSLATDIAEHALRVAHIRDGSADAKSRLSALGDVGAAQYGLLISSLAAASQIAGLPIYLTIPANLVVTNLIGPTRTGFLAGARVQGIYAHAPMADGVGLNIALISYAGSACVGLTADPGLVDDLDELADRLQETADALIRSAKAR